MTKENLVRRRISATSVTLGAGVETVALNSSSKAVGSAAEWKEEEKEEERVEERVEEGEEGERGGEGDEEEETEEDGAEEGEGKKTS